MTSFAKPTSLCGAALVALLAVALPIVASGSAVAQGTQAPAAAAAPAQPPPPPAAPATPSPPPAPIAVAPLVPPQSPPAYKPGFLHQLKVWWDDSIAVFDTKGKDTPGKADDLNRKSDDAAKSAVDAAKDATKSAATATQDAMKNAVEATKGAATTATDAMKNAMEATKNAATAIVRLPNTRIVDVHETCARAPNGAPDCAAAAASGCRGKGFNTGNPLDVRTAEKCDTTALQAGHLPGQRECAVETVVIRAVCQ
jgi:hypothetical protein